MWVEPLALQTWLINVFAGNPEIFAAIAIFAITSMAGFFRMTGIALFFMLGIFVLMFSGYIGTSFMILFGLIGGLIVGYTIQKVLQ